MEHPTAYDLAGWPEDVRETVSTVCELWHMHPPATKVSKALWIRDARELADACGEYGSKILSDYRAEFESYMGAHRGVAMHTVSGPGSLVKMVRDCARRRREQEGQNDRTRYISGEFAEFIHH
jgi:hypothetical protein